jgi:hypothetical protein
MIRLMAALLAVSVLAAPAAAQVFDPGVAAFKRGDYAGALRAWEPLAVKGNPEAQNNLGVLHANGYGVPRDDVQACFWFNLAAAQNHRDAARNRDVLLGRMAPADVSRALFMVRRWNESRVR